METSIILVRPLYAGNVGSVARAMKNMGLKDLRLVAPEADRGDDMAIKMAMGGRDVLEGAQIYSDLPAAIGNLKWVLGTSRRRGKERGNFMSVREFGEQAVTLPKGHPVGIVFGTEDKGLLNEEIALCQGILTIPTHQDFGSLNLAQAVLVVAYEILVASLGPQASPPKIGEEAVARVEDFEGMVADLKSLLLEAGFLDLHNPDHLIRLLRHLFNRARPSEKEVKILRGMCRQLRWWKEHGDEPQKT